MNRTSRFAPFAAATGLVVGATLLCAALRPLLTAPNIVLVYLLAVVVAALRLGRNPAFLAAALGVLGFNFFFVPPLYSFRVADPEHLLTFAGLLTVGGVVSSLVARAHEQAEALARRETQTASLYRMSRELAGAGDSPQVLAAVRRSLEESVGGTVALFLVRGEEGGELELAAASDGFVPSERDWQIANWSRASRRAAGWGTGTYESPGVLFLPLLAPPSIVGVLALRYPASAERGGDSREPAISRPWVDATASQAALALQRVRLAEREETAKIVAARGTLERALLNSISHDFRTPLVTITGALSGVLDETQALPAEAQRELLTAAFGEAQRLDRFVGNLLDITRLDSGALQPKLELCELEELVGCALAAGARALGDRPVTLQLEPLAQAPLDLVLMTQVLVNLLENSARHSPAGRPIEVAGRSEEWALRIDVIDHGNGVPAQDLPRLFERFFHVPVPEGSGGTGLGLSICKGLVEAHGGTIDASPTPGGGLTVSIRLPAGTSPAPQAYG